MTMEIDFEQLHQKIIPVIKAANNITLRSFGELHQVIIKDGVASQAAEVTETDREIDRLFHDELTKIFPDFGFITEEGLQKELKEYNWIIDPIDGTTNFRHGFLFFGISVALWKGSTPIYGCVSLPKFNTVMYGWKKGGVWIDGIRTENSNASTGKPLVLLAPVANPQEHGKIIELIGEILSAPRDLGCCVYQGFETIAGKADVAVMYKLSLWDIGALVLLGQEAGLSVEYVSPKPDLAKDNPKSYAHTVVI